MQASFKPAGQQPTTAQPQATEPEVIRNLMVNYIPTTIDEVQLRQLFEMYGPVESVKIVVDRDTRTSKGYGFVKFRFSGAATYAIQYLNGYPLMNKRLKVAYSQQAEAHKVLAQQQQPTAAVVDPATAYQFAGAQPAATPVASDETSQAWAQQMGYLQQVAAFQLMGQYQQPGQQQPAAVQQPQMQQPQMQHQHMAPVEQAPPGQQ